MKPLHVHVVLSTLNHLAFNGTRVAVTLYAAWLQASPATIGLIAASFGMVSAFTAVPMGRWIDRAGPRAPMILASAVMTACMLLMAGAQKLWPQYPLGLFFVVCPLVGMFNSTFQIATQQTIGQYGGPGDRANNFAAQSLGVSMATFAGPLIAGIAIDHLSHPVAFVLMSAIACLPAFVIGGGHLHFPPHQKSREQGNTPGGWRLLKERQLRKAYVVATLNNAIWSVVSFMIPIYGVQIGLSATAIGTLMACLSAGVVGIRLVMPVLSRRWRAWQMVLVAQGMIGVGFVGMPFTAVYALLVGLAIVTGIGLGLSGPLSTSLMYDASPPGKVAEVVGLRMTMANLAQTVVPLMSGAVGAAVGVGPVFWAVAALVFGDVWSNRSKLSQPT